MPKIDLPPVVEKYFAAKEGGDAGATLALFAENATVWDNGEDLKLEGKDSIRQWIAGTVAEYKLTSEVKSVEETDGGLEARVVVSGDFPGSPYEFAYRFKLQDGMISELAIDPIGSLAQ